MYIYFSVRYRRHGTNASLRHGIFAMHNSDHSCVPENQKLSLESPSSHLEAIVKKVDTNTTSVNNILAENTKRFNEVNELVRLRKKLHILTRENVSLKSENEQLTERTNNLSYILADPHWKTKKC